MKLYGHFFSAPCNMTRLAASAMDVEHEYHHVDLTAGEQQSPDYLKISRFGMVPALEDNGFTLCESGAICRYMATKENSPLYPQAPQERAIVDQWMDYANQHVRQSMSKILFNKFFAPMMDKPVDEKSMADGREFLAKQLPNVETALSASPYLAGNSLSLADIAMVAAMEPFEMIEVSLNDYPAITKWRQGLMAADWYTTVHTHYAAEMQG